MRLSKPAEGQIYKETQTSGKTLRLKRRVNRRVLLIAGAILIILIVAFVWNRHYQRNKQQAVPNASESAVNALKGSKDINDQRSLASEYLSTGDFVNAEATAKTVAQKTQTLKDYESLLNICAYYAVPNKNACLKEVVNFMKPMISRLAFYDAYTTATALDESKYTKDTALFYQRAYDTYPPSVDQYTKTKDQVKQRIAALNG